MNKPIEEMDRAELIRAAMSAIGSARSEVKARSSRENGKKGGRSPKRPVDVPTANNEAPDPKRRS